MYACSADLHAHGLPCHACSWRHPRLHPRHASLGQAWPEHGRPAHRHGRPHARLHRRRLLRGLHGCLGGGGPLPGRAAGRAAARLLLLHHHLPLLHGRHLGQVGVLLVLNRLAHAGLERLQMQGGREAGAVRGKQGEVGLVRAGGL